MEPLRGFIMRKKLFFGAGLLGVFVVGCLTGYQWRAAVGPVAAETLAEASGPASDWSQRATLQAEKIASLEAALSDANEKLASTRVSEEMPQERAEEVPEVSGFRRQMEWRTERRVNRLAEQLGLDVVQTDAVRAIFARRLDYIEARRRGDTVDPFNLDAELEQVLTADQFAAYMERSQEEIFNRAELVATGQLVRMNQLIDLDPSVESVVYEAVHLTAQEAMIARETGESFPMREILDERLSSLLSAEQMEQLRQEQGGLGMGPGGGMGPGRPGP